MNPTQQQILNDALHLAETHGYDRVSRAMVARRSGLSETLVSYYWTASDLRAAILRLAIEREVLTVIAQGLVDRHPLALDAPADLRVRAAESIVSE